MARSIVALSLVSLVSLASACSPAASPRVQTDTPAHATPESIEVRGTFAQRATVAPAAMPAPRTPLLSFDAVADDLERACRAKDPEPTTIAMKEAGAAEVACITAKADEAKRALVASLAPSDARVKRVEALDVAFAAYANDVCWATEEVSWVDLDEGTRDDGTLRGFAWLACESRVQTERAYLYETMKNDSAGYARHLADVQPRGRREAFFLGDLSHKAAALSSKKASSPRTVGYPKSLDGAERAEYVTRFGAIASGAPSLARETCGVFEDLGRAIDACEAKAKLGYLALGAYEANGEDAGP